MTHIRDEIYLRIESERLKQERAGQVHTTLFGELRAILKIVIGMLLDADR